MNFELDLKPFLRKENSSEVRNMALEYVLGMTLSCEGLEYLKQNALLPIIISSMFEVPTRAEAVKCLINLSADNSFARTLVQSPIIIKHIFDDLLKKDNKSADNIIQIVSNLTNYENGAIKVAEFLKTEPDIFNKLIEMMCCPNYNQHCKCDASGTILCNVTQAKEGRLLFLKERKELFDKLLPMTTYQESELRRLSVVGIIKNCCFETEELDVLLIVDFLEYVLLPLAGPEVLDDDEMDCLPLNLQFLNENKSRDPVSSIRKTLLEALCQLCAIRKGREFLRSNGTYFILREYHKSEVEEELKKACEDVIDLLNRDEEEMNVDNLKQVILEEEEMKIVQQKEIVYVQKE